MTRRSSIFTLTTVMAGLALASFVAVSQEGGGGLNVIGCYSCHNGPNGG